MLTLTGVPKRKMNSLSRLKAHRQSEKSLRAKKHRPRQPLGQVVAACVRIVTEAGTLLLMVGCASFTTTQSDISYDEAGIPTRTVKTRITARTFFEARSALANFKASQTDKTQGASVGALTHEATSTNINNLAEAVAAGAVRGALYP